MPSKSYPSTAMIEALSPALCSNRRIPGKSPQQFRDHRNCLAITFWLMPWNSRANRPSDSPMSFRIHFCKRQDLLHS